MVSLKSAHLYRSVPKDLTTATHTGGAISVLAIFAIVALLVSNAQRFYAVRVERTMEIDQVYDESMVVSFNITLPRLPCALASLDLTDALGTSIHNVTRGLSKMRIDEHTNEKLLSRADYRWMRPNPTPEIRSQELTGHKKRPLVEIAPHLDVPAFLRKAGRAQLAVVLFGASWCEWSRQFKPTLEYLRAQLQAAHVGEEMVEIFSVDCGLSAKAEHRAEERREARSAQLYFEDEGIHPPLIQPSLKAPLHPHHPPGGRKLLAAEAAEAHGAARTAWRAAADHAARGDGRLSDERDSEADSAAALCSALHISSYPTMRIFQKGQAKDAFNWVGPADHEPLFFAILGWLRRSPDGAKVVSGFEARSADLARPYVQRMAALHPSEANAKRAPNSSDLAALRDVASIRHEALLAGVPAYALDAMMGAKGDGSSVPKLPPVLHDFEAAADGAEGCEVSGTLKLQRVPGTLRLNAHAHHVSLEPGWLNLTHTINTLVFAKQLNRTHVQHSLANFVTSPVINSTLLRAVAPLKEGRNMHPLHGKHFSARYRHSDIAHYLKVIPSSYSFVAGEEGELYLYTANNRFNVRESATPSLAIGIDISPMRMFYREYREDWTSFLTSTCAVIGGVFTVFGMVVALLDTSSEVFSKKSI